MKIIMLLTLFITALMSNDYKIEAKYEITYGILGSIGDASADLKVEKGTYKIKLKAKARGLVKILSSSRVETHESTGIVKDGKFLPTIFISSKKRGSKTDIKRYLFDHDKKVVKLLQTRIRDGEIVDTKSILPYFAQDDILTLFFNLKYFLGEDYTPKVGQKLVAVGANKKNGEVELFKADSKMYKDLSKELKSRENLLVVVLNQRVFASQKGEMIINLNSDGICTSALLKDVIMFGDIRGELVSLKVKKQEKN
jgi:hypothetical protein